MALPRGDEVAPGADHRRLLVASSNPVVMRGEGLPGCQVETFVSCVARRILFVVGGQCAGRDRILCNQQATTKPGIGRQTLGS